MSFFFMPARCGARITQPVCPVQCITSSAASFSGRYGSPPLPKIASTKSRLLTRLPGAKKRISMVFCGSRSVAGQTIGRSSSETNSRTGSLLIGREGQRQQIWRRPERRRQQCGKSLLGNRQLVGRNRQAPFDNVKNSLRGAPVALGIVQDALRHAIGLQIWRSKRVAAKRQRHHTRQPRPVQQERIRREAARRPAGQMSFR